MTCSKRRVRWRARGDDVGDRLVNAIATSSSTNCRGARKTMFDAVLSFHAPKRTVLSLEVSDSMGNHDSEIVDASRVD